MSSWQRGFHFTFSPGNENSRVARRLGLAAGTALAQDYEREKRWAAEVSSSLVVGDAVQVKLSSGRASLGLYTEAKPAKGTAILVHGVGVHPDHGVIGVLRADWRRRFTLNWIAGSKQVRIAAADHHFTGKENELAAAIAEFLSQTLRSTQ